MEAKFAGATHHNLKPLTILDFGFTILKSTTIEQYLAEQNYQLKIKNLEFSTVVWYCASTGKLHAGYRATVKDLHFADAVEQRSPGFEYQETEGV